MPLREMRGKTPRFLAAWTNESSIPAVFDLSPSTDEGRSASPDPRRSHSDRQYRTVAIGIIAMMACGLDLLSKHWIFDWLGAPPNHKLHWIWKGHFALETSINTGALAGIGSGHTGLLAVISIVATIVVLVWVVSGGAISDWYVTIATGLILGGIWGNLYDRLGIWGVVGVRDWIRWQYHDWIWPNFNLADSFLVCGSALLMLHAFRNPNSKRTNDSAAEVAQ